jgi:uncharacterized protein YjiK
MGFMLGTKMNIINRFKMMIPVKNALLSFLLAILSLSGCGNGGDEMVIEELELIGTFPVNIPEPSGLAMNESGTGLYTVSDNTNNIYKISLKGNVIQKFQYTGNDLEGVSLFTTNKLLVAEERNKEIVVYDLLTNAIVKHKIDYNNSDANSGLEGVAYNFDNGIIYALNEKDPGLLIQLRSNFSINSQTELDFAIDYSGICYDSSIKKLWIVSDQNQTINKCDLNGDLIKSYPINVIKAEGIAVTDKEIYIISDGTAKLYIFKKPIE